MTSLVESPRYIDQIYERIVSEIADGTLQPGQRISQEDLAERFNVSRQPVSHAIQLLKRQALVRDAGRKGIEISPIDPAYVRSLYQVRMVIEHLAVRLAAERVASGAADAASRRHASDCLAHGKQLLGDSEFVDQSRLVGLIQADVAFHTAIYRMTGNPSIEDILVPQWLHFRRAMIKVLDTSEAKRRAWVVHAQILDCILSGRPEAAQAAIVEHGEDTVAAIEGRLAPPANR